MSSSRRLQALVTLVAAAAASFPGAAAAAVTGQRLPCQPGISVSLLPVDEPRPEGRERSYVIADLRPGESLQRTMRVCNGTDQPVRVDLYANAATISDGSFLPLGSPRADNALSRWTSVRPSSLRLQPDVPAQVQIEIAVPADAEPGERYGVVYAELPPAAGGSGIGVASRVGVRQYVFVRGDAAPQTDFTIRTLTATRSADGRPVVRAEVQNTGDRAIDVAGTLRLTEGPGGVGAGPFPATAGTTVAPGVSAPVEVVLDPALPAGPWLARLDLASGSTRRAAEAAITFPDSAGGESAPVTAENLPLQEDPDVVIPVAIGILSLVALLLLLALWRRRSRRKTAEGEPAG